MPLTESEDKVIKRLKAMSPRLEEWLEEFVAMDSHTANHEGVNAFGWRLEQELMQSGLYTSSFVTGVSGQYLLGRTRVDEGNRLMILGHMDTVFPTGSTELSLKRAQADEVRLCGPGAADMKGGLVVLLGALRALHEEGLLEDRSLQVILSADEEVGSPAGRDLIAREAEEVHLCLVLEMGSPMEDGGSRFVTARRGMARFRLKIRGVAAHAGVAPEEGLSAALEAAHKVIALEALSNPEDDLVVNVGLLHAGSAVNTVPEHAELEIDCRFSDPAKGEELVAAIRRICAQAACSHPRSGDGCELILEEGASYPPMVRSDAMARMASRIQAWGRDLGLSLEEESRGGCSDANIVAASGTPTVDGLGVVGGKIHSRDEWLQARSLFERSALLALTIMRFHEL